MTSVNVSSVSNTVVVIENDTTTVVQVPVTTIVTAFTQGPQGPSGIQAGALPTGGDPGNILIKETYDNYQATWVSTLDGGTFN